MDSGKTSKARKTWEGKVATYVVAGGAVLGAAASAHATPIYSGVQDIAIGVDDDVPIDLNGDAFVDYTFRNATFFLGDPTLTNRYLEIGGGANGVVGTSSTFQFATALAAGVPLPGVESFLNGSLKLGRVFEDGTSDGSFVGLTNGYLGLRFDIAGQLHFGWARVSVSGSTDINNALTATLHDWAYEGAAGAPILVGQIDAAPTAVPEPGTLSLLALGASGLAAYRRRKNAGRTGDAGAATE
jgi:hypothetical protein